jgi:hypothetical protein
MTIGLKYLLLAIVLVVLVALHMAGGVGFLLALPLYYASFKLAYMETGDKK